MLKDILTIIRKGITVLIIIGLLTSNGKILFSASFYGALYGSLFDVVPFQWHKNSLHEKWSTNNAQLKSIETKTKKIANRVSKRTIRNITTNLAAVPAESIPFLGMATILAITAMDLKGACDDMKDMDELKGIFSTSDGEKADKVCGLRVPSKDEVF